MTAVVHNLHHIVTPLAPSDDVYPFSARLKRGYLLRFFVVTVVLAACTAAVVVFIARREREAVVAVTQSFPLVVMWMVLVSLELQVDAILAQHSEHGMPKKLRMQMAWLGEAVSVRRLNRVLLTIYVAIAVLVFLFSTGLLSLLLSFMYQCSLTLPGIAHTHVEPVRV